MHYCGIGGVYRGAFIGPQQWPPCLSWHLGCVVFVHISLIQSVHTGGRPDKQGCKYMLTVQALSCMF